MAGAVNPRSKRLLRISPRPIWSARLSSRERLITATMDWFDCSVRTQHAVQRVTDRTYRTRTCPSIAPTDKANGHRSGITDLAVGDHDHGETGWLPSLNVPGDYQGRLARPSNRLS